MICSGIDQRVLLARKPFSEFCSLLLISAALDQSLLFMSNVEGIALLTIRYRMPSFPTGPLDTISSGELPTAELNVSTREPSLQCHRTLIFPFRPARQEPVALRCRDDSARSFE